MKRISKKELIVAASLILVSCGGGNEPSTSDATDTATWSAWSQWTPATAASNVQQINQTRTRTCQVMINGNADSPAVTCSGGAVNGGSESQTQSVDNPDYDANNGANNSDPADTATWSAWSQWVPATAASNIQQIIQTRTRTCQIMINGNADSPAVTCSGGAVNGGSESQTQSVDNPDYDANNGANNSDPADTATWSAWSQWAPATAASNIQQIIQTRTRTCQIMINGNADSPAVTCSGGAVNGGSESQTQSVDNPDYDASNSDPIDTATWSVWSQWTPASTTDTSVITIEQTRTRTCNVAVNGIKDNPAPTCSGETSETRDVTNTLAADTLTFGTWDEWSPASNTDTSVISIEQTRIRNCSVTINGNEDMPALTCTGKTSETQTVANPLAADTLTFGTWDEWSPASNTDTSVISIEQTRIRNCSVTINGNEDMPALTCTGKTSETQTVANPLAADTLTFGGWGEWSPASNTDTSVISIEQTRIRNCSVTINGNEDMPALTCTGKTSETQTVANPLAADTLTFGTWDEWSPASNTDTSVISIEQTRIRNCSVTINGNEDMPALTCTGKTSETQTVANPLAADTLTFGTWDEWSPASNTDTDTSVISIEQTRIRNCSVTINGNEDMPALTCTGKTSETQTVANSLAADTAAWSAWSPASNTDTSVYRITQTRVCAVTVIGNTDTIVPTCDASGDTSQTQSVKNPNFVFGLIGNGVTIACDGLDNGDTFTIGVTTYTKRSKTEINRCNAATSCTSGITDMYRLLRTGLGSPDNCHGLGANNVSVNSSFNDDISHWDTSSVSSMSEMFRGTTSFNGNIGSWDTSSVSSMDSMFSDVTAFNANISAWNTSSVRYMNGMFTSSSNFNQDISNWDTSNVINMSFMFNNAASFNQGIGKWNTSNVSEMTAMFNSAIIFNQDLSSWCVSQLSTPEGFSYNSALVADNLPNWGQPCNSGSGKIIYMPITIENNPFSND